MTVPRAAGLALLLVLTLALPAPAAETAAAKRAAAAYRTLLKQYDDAVSAYQKALQGAKTAKERRQVFQEKHPKVGTFAKRFTALAREHAGTPAAVDALSWVVTHPVDPTIPEARLRADALAAL